jgi:hypothetical protein
MIEPKEASSEMRAEKSSVQVLLPNRLAPKEKWRLWTGLEKFANLGNSFEGFTKFAKLWPTFSPYEIRQGGPLGEPMGLVPDTNVHVLVLTYRDYLRRVWISDPDVDARGHADILLGLQREPASHSADAGAEVGLRKLVSVGSLIASLTPSGSNQFAASPKVAASWKTGDFTYYPLTDFQRAFYWLFRESWRARTCARCGAYFIADKPPTRYCSTACSGEAKRKRSLDWWKREGDARRRTKKERKRRK